MKITKEQLLKLFNLKIGDKVNIKDTMNKNPHKLNIHLEFVDEYGRVSYSIEEMAKYEKEFEIIEDKIWDIEEIEEYDGMYCVDIDMDIAALCYEKHPQYFNDIIEKSVAFKKREYAEEYRKELLKFNEEYKRKHRG